jgi:hypothetical protein
MMNYTKLSLAEVRTAIGDVARDAVETFGGLDEDALNWQPERARWSVAQCFDHLLRANALLLQAADSALRGPMSVWQRVPWLPALCGWTLIRSQSPNTRGKFTAPVRARPTTSQISGDVIQRFVAQHADAEAWTRSLDQDRAGHSIMVSPFIGVVTYSVMNGLRLLVAHDRRHFEQARRVMQSPGFAGGS